MLETVHSIGGYRVTDEVLGAVREASQRTGADFDYMMAQAAQESAFRADARAPTSSATGLYQFIDSTWLAMVKQHGDKYGLGAEADAIERRANGRYGVDDAETRRDILDLRNDPRLNALMAGEFAQANESHLERTVGGSIGATELYFAHFLGANGASRFLNARHDNPYQLGADLFPAAAAANQAVFYHPSTGQPRTLDEIYDWMDQKMDRGEGLAAAAPDGPSGPVMGGPEAFFARPYEGDPFLHRHRALLDAETQMLGPITGTPPLVANGLSLWAVLTLSTLPMPTAQVSPGAQSSGESPSATSSGGDQAASGAGNDDNPLRPMG